MIELTPLSASLIGEEDGGEVEGETKAAGRIGPSKMSTHSLTLSPPDEPGVGLAGLIPGEGNGSGAVVVGTTGNIWACLEIEDEWVFRAMMEELRRIVLDDLSEWDLSDSGGFA